MNVKSKIISEIDSVISSYEDEKNTTDWTVKDNTSRIYEIAGAMHALDRLKIQVVAIEIKTYSIIEIVEEKKTASIMPPESFLNHVLLEIKGILEDKGTDGLLGSGANPDAMPGRKEACQKIKAFVLKLDAELKTHYETGSS